MPVKKTKKKEKKKRKESCVTGSKHINFKFEKQNCVHLEFFSPSFSHCFITFWLRCNSFVQFHFIRFFLNCMVGSWKASSRLNNWQSGRNQQIDILTQFHRRFDQFDVFMGIINLSRTTHIFINQCQAESVLFGYFCTSEN